MAKRRSRSRSRGRRRRSRSRSRSRRRKRKGKKGKKGTKSNPFSSKAKAMRSTKKGVRYFKRKGRTQKLRRRK
jgi:hypothetical protein